MDEIILKAEDLYFSYDDEKTHSLNGLTLQIRRGSKVAFMGANGSGKSTFFLCCNGIHKPSSGTLSFMGSPIDYSKKGLLALRSRVGIVFQDPDSQLFSANVFQEISFGILNLGVPEDEARTTVNDVIGQLEITPFRDKPTHALSGGEKKQVSIADILVMHPDIIILDEPSAALDPKHEQMVNRIVDQLTEKGITVLMSTHSVDYALAWADEIVLMHEGRVLMQSDPISVFSNKTALAKTNLEQPAVMQIFDRLCRKGILRPDLAPPKTLVQLENCIAEIKGTTYPKENNAVDKNAKQAILVVSFGTTHEDTRISCIEAIEQSIAQSYPNHKVYRAWTSKMIIAKLAKRDHLHIDTVSEAMRRMLDDGITDVIIQPTHVINGVENEQMKEDALVFHSAFRSILFGDPLLTSQEDQTAVIQAVADEFSSLSDEEALVLMGHGTTHFANATYAALDYHFKDLGYKNIFLGTVEAYPSMDSLLRQVADYGPKRVTLAPFMIVAGDHAKNDLSGDDPASWYNQFRSAGYPVSCIMRGLGEYEGIRSLFLQHIKEAQ